MNMIAAVVQAATGCTKELAALFAPHLSDACTCYGINTPQRLAGFLAQVAHESGSLKYTAELWGPTPAQQRYEGRADLGNTQLGDGSLYRGHGLIQVTGRFNHCKTRDRLRVVLGEQTVPDFERVPAALEQPQWAAWSAAEYWASHGCNELADAGDFTSITRRINGGLNGQADRLERWERAKAALGAQDQATAADRAPAAPTPPPAPIEAPVAVSKPPTTIKEPAMGASLLWGLASSLIDIFTPLAREKITKEVGRHTTDTAVQDQVATSVIEAAKTLTGKDDPIEAVVAAKTDPTVVAQVEMSALDTLDRLAPVLDKLATWDKQAWDASEASAAAADQRSKGDPNDQDTFLTRSIVVLTIGILAACCILIGVLAWLKMDTAVAGVLGLLTTGAGMVYGKFGSRYDHRYGSTRSSGAKDVVIGELSRKNRPGGVA